MKIIFFLAMLLPASAFASKARMAALGQDADLGSYYLNDTRNHFRIPLNFRGADRLIYLETNNNVPGSNTADGGFFGDWDSQWGNISYGIFLGDNSWSQAAEFDGTATSGYADAGTIGDADFLTEARSYDLFFSGKKNFEWGVRIHHATNADENQTAMAKERKYSILGIGAAAKWENYTLWANLNPSEEAEGASTGEDAAEWEGDILFNLGASTTKWNSQFWIDLAKAGGEYSPVGAGKMETEVTSVVLGAGRVHEISNTQRFNMDLNFHWSKAEDKAAGTTTEVSTVALPLVVGFEVDGADWLVLRASIKQNLLLDQMKTKVSGAATRKNDLGTRTTYNLGATLKLRSLEVDGLLALRGNGVPGTAGTFGTSELINTISLAYKF